MADEEVTQEEVTKEQPEASAPPVEIDWEKFWGGEEIEEAVAEATVASAPAMTQETAEQAEKIEEDQMARLQKELADLKTLVSTRVTNLELQHKMEDAVNAWKQQAGPFEQDLAYLVERSQTPEQFKANVSTVRTMAANLAKRQEEREKLILAQAEREMQEKFGLPVTPSFTPPPRQAKVEEALSGHDLDAAAKALVEGMF